MPTSVTDLDSAFKKHFRISDIHWCKDNGGQKVVYCVTRGDTKCILKIYRNFNSRDIRELEIYEKFKSLPDIPKIIETNKYEKDTISFEKFIDGDCLEDKISYFKAKEVEVASLLLGICKIMKPLWESEEQIVHRDIKPSNIIVKSDGTPAVIDFGIAKDTLATTVTSTGFQPNSWPFASPEQYFNRKEDIHYRTDFFCIGTVGYYLVNGKLPFGDSPSEIEKNFRNRSFKISLNPEGKLAPFLAEALSVAIAERPRSANEMIKLLAI